MATVFFTGFPGFLGSELLPRVLKRRADAKAVCLVQGKFMEMAQGRRDELIARDSTLRGRIDLVAGDITQPNLGLGSGGDEIRRDTVEIYHLAAVYDLSVPRDVAMRVNVQGTALILDFAKNCPDLGRLQYVSTCYVSGRYEGTFSEGDLAKGQTFNNFYEETKYLAEVDVQEAMKAGLPTSIYRPSIVVGDSETGATQKYDGPYYVIRWLLRQPKQLALMPVCGDPTASTVNVVPRDFVVSAIDYLSGSPKALGKVYQLADPDPLTVDALLSELERATERRMVRIPLPTQLAKTAIDKVPGVYNLIQIPSSAIDYFVHPTRYTTDNTQADLADSGITVPRMRDYLGHLVDFVRAHPEVGAKAMV